MGNSIGAVMDDFSGKRCTFFIMIVFLDPLEMMKYEFFFYY